MSLYLLHIEPRYKHAGHYLGFCESDNVDRRVNQHLAAGSKASPLVLAALMSGCTVTLARKWEGPQYDRKAERAKKARGHARLCPLCRQQIQKGGIAQ
jgi:hypothetical protein